jgi:hypothetical protein
MDQELQRGKAGSLPEHHQQRTDHLQKGTVCKIKYKLLQIGRAKPRNPTGIFAHTNHQPHRPRFHAAWVETGSLINP